MTISIFPSPGFCLKPFFTMFGCFNSWCSNLQWYTATTLYIKSILTLGNLKTFLLVQVWKGLKIANLKEKQKARKGAHWKVQSNVKREAGEVENISLLRRGCICCCNKIQVVPNLFQLALWHYLGVIQGKYNFVKMFYCTVSGHDLKRNNHALRGSLWTIFFGFELKIFFLFFLTPSRWAQSEI